MSEEEKPKTGFTLAEIRVLKYLGLVLGAVACGIGLVGVGTGEQILAIGLVAAMMAAVPLVIYFLRRRRAGR